MSNQFPTPWRLDLGMDEIGNNLFGMYVLDSEGNIICMVYGKTSEDCEVVGHVIINNANGYNALSSELNDIRKSINADDNESTFDEVERLKGRFEKTVSALNQIEDMIDELPEDYDPGGTLMDIQDVARRARGNKIGVYGQELTDPSVLEGDDKPTGIEHNI